MFDTTELPFEDAESSSAQLPYNLVQLVTLIIIMVLSVITIVVNPFTIVAITQMKKKATNVFIFSLCGADFVTGISAFLVKFPDFLMMTTPVSNMDFLSIVSWISVGLGTASFLVSMASACLIGFDRAIATLKPLQYTSWVTYGRGLLITVLAWAAIFAIIFVPLPVTISQLKGPLPYARSPGQLYDRKYVQYFTSPLAGLFMIGNIMLYAVIAIVFTKVSRKVTTSTSELKTRRFTRLSLIIVGLLLLGNLPISLLSAFPPRPDPKILERHGIIHNFLFIPMLIPTFTNNFIYAWRQPDFRDAYRKVLCCFTRNSVSPSVATLS